MFLIAQLNVESKVTLIMELRKPLEKGPKTVTEKQFGKTKSKGSACPHSEERFLNFIIGIFLSHRV